jgi:phosphotransferase system HPr (HPr) family protein
MREEKELIEETVKVLNPVGLHARSAAVMVQAASKFNSKILLIKGDRDADAKSIMNILALNVMQYEEMTVRITGEDEEEAMKEVIGLVQNDFEIEKNEKQ